MENKCIKKSTFSQLQALVEYMEEHPELARGTVVFGGTKMSTEEQWMILAKKLHSLGPPLRSVAEWKKTWADLKSRTKKKIAENHKSICETGGGLYRVNSLSEFEQTVDKILFLSKAAAPGGKVFGVLDKNSSKTADTIDNCFIAINDTPPRSNKVVAVISPSRQQEKQPIRPLQQTTRQSQPPQSQKRPKPFEDSDDELPSCCSAKKRKYRSDNQSNHLIRRQLKVSEETAAAEKEQANAIKTLAEATQNIAASIKDIKRRFSSGGSGQEIQRN